jgi:hypothetical protein
MQGVKRNVHRVSWDSEKERDHYEDTAARIKIQ